MTAREKKRKPLIMLAVDVGGYSVATVDLAVRMAASTKARLRGLFIEDEDLLQMTGLPFAREIGLTSARERPTDVEAMQRSMRMVARRFEQALKQEAAALKIRCGFDYVRGRALDLGSKHAVDATYVILGQAASTRLRPQPARAPRRILLLANHSRHQLRALEAVLERFGGDKIELTLVGAEPGSELAAAVDRLRQDERHGIRLRQIDRGQLFERLAERGSGFDCAILPRDEPVRDLQLLLKSLRCPVILVA